MCSQIRCQSQARTDATISSQYREPALAGVMRSKSGVPWTWRRKHTHTNKQTSKRASMPTPEQSRAEHSTQPALSAPLPHPHPVCMGSLMVLPVPRPLLA